jgi:hypothetical protein
MFESAAACEAKQRTLSASDFLADSDVESSKRIAAMNHGAVRSWPRGQLQHQDFFRETYRDSKQI